MITHANKHVNQLSKQNLNWCLFELFGFKRVLLGGVVHFWQFWSLSAHCAVLHHSIQNCCGGQPIFDRKYVPEFSWEEGVGDMPRDFYLPAVIFWHHGLGVGAGIGPTGSGFDLIKFVIKTRNRSLTFLTGTTTYSFVDSTNCPTEPIKVQSSQLRMNLNIWYLKSKQL